MDEGAAHAPGGRLMAHRTADRQRLGVYLVTTITVGWLVLMVSLQFVQAARHGYGSGFGDGGRIPPAIVRQAGVGVDRQAIADVLNEPGAEAGIWGETWRITVTVIVLLAIIGVWYLVMSRVGTF